MRRIAVILHRYVGLALAGFLILMGLTGSVIAFHHELDRWLNPGVLTVEPVDEPLPPSEWIEAAEEAHPKARVNFVTMPRSDTEPATLFLVPRKDPKTGEPHELNVDQTFVHPATAEVLGSRDRDGFRFDRLHAVRFIYTLHYSLHLGGWGMWLLGAVAIVWLFDCFVGLYLAWPRRTWAAIKRAFTVRFGASAPRINYDLHRAGGLWVWPILIVLAFSGMSMNLHEEVFDPLMHAVAPMTPWPGEVAEARADPAEPVAVGPGRAVELAGHRLDGHRLAGDVGAIWINHAKGLYHIGYHTGEDLMSQHPGAWVTVDASRGRAIDVRPPEGLTAGDAIHDWQFPLHSGKAFGLAGRIIICISGLVVAMLSATGLYIWWKKRRGRMPRKLETAPSAVAAAESEAELAEPVAAATASHLHAER